MGSLRIFTRDNNSTIPGKVNGTPTTITIDTNGEVSTVRRGFVGAEDLGTISETIRLKTVTGELTPIMGEATVEIYIGQLTSLLVIIRHG
ncbi:hypothetical protein Zmor_002315 [Zophobas morio]|uniref:Uncharacterized protein n=1 Tax=Zophobas morio TaxID=2755281 RepID=A0AA38MPX0_9CUCU|nr:hypothetical protein Zmor_002315 [Zophobas morio]